MSYRNPQQVVDTQTGQHYRNLQKSLSSTFAGVAQSYKTEQDKLEKEQKQREAKNKAIVDFNQKQEDAMMGSVAKLKAKNPTLDTSAIYDMVDRYSDIKNAIDLGTITDKAELRKMREQLAQIKSIPDGLNTSLVGFGALSEDFTEYMAKAGKKGGLDLKSADPTVLNHLNVFLNKSKGERKFETQFDENGNMRTGIFIKSNEEGDKGKFYTKDELVSYMDGETGGLPKIYDDTKDSEEMKSLIVGKNIETGRTVVKEDYLIEKKQKREDGTIEVVKAIDESKVKNSLRPLATATIKSLSDRELLSYYNNVLDGPKISIKDLEGDMGSMLKENISEIYLEKFMEDNDLVDFKKRSYIYKQKSKSNEKESDNIEDATSLIDELKFDDRLKFDIDNFRDLASDIGLTVNAEYNTQEDADSNNISRLVLGEYRGKKLSIDKNDKPYQIINKIIRIKYPRLSEAQYKQLTKEASKLKAGEGVLAPANNSTTTDFFGNPIQG